MGMSIAPVSAKRMNLWGASQLRSGDRLFRVFEKEGQVYQSDTESSGGSTVFVNEMPLAWSIGSGDNGVTFAVRRGGYLFEAPLSWYAKTRRWDFSPGYETLDEGFSRPISQSCIVCHAGRSRPLRGKEGMYADPPFDEPAIGCENCHGPGQIHVLERGLGKANTPDLSIVNPARLPARMAEEICMMCHQAGQTRALLPGREYADFRPGVPLIRTVAIADVADRNSQTPLLDHHDSMLLSRCYQGSAGKLSCLSCHNPHEQPGSQAAPAYFRAKCLTCHTDSSCRLPLAQRRAREPKDDCAGCHMPRREAGLIAHSALTDHRIPARPGQPLTTTLSAPGGIPGVRVLNAREGEPALPAITRLELLGALRDRDSRLTPQYKSALDEAVRTTPDDPLVLAVLGRDALAGNSAEAVPLLLKAEKVEAERQGSARASTYVDLSDAYLRNNLSADAAAALERGQAAWPWSKDIRKRLVLARIQQKDYVKAEAALRSYVQDFPEDSFMRGLLNRVGAGR